MLQRLLMSGYICDGKDYKPQGCLVQKEKKWLFYDRQKKFWILTTARKLVASQSPPLEPEISHVREKIDDFFLASRKGRKLN
jgi:hypothetical protein